MSQPNVLALGAKSGTQDAPLGHIRSIMHRSISLLEGANSPYKSGASENCFWFTNGIAYPFFNQVTIYNEDPEIFDNALIRFYELNTVHQIYLGGAGLIHAKALEAKGYVNTSTLPLMAIALDASNANYKLASGLEVRRVTSNDELNTAQEIMSIAYGMNPEEIQKYSAPSLGVPDSYRYILFDGEVAVSTAHFLRVGNSLACWDLATRPERERNGHAQALMRWVLSTHFALGDSLIVLQPSKKGHPLYRRLGFQTLEYLQGWVMEETERMRRFTHHTLQFGEYTLRPSVESDASWMIEYLNDPELQKWFNFTEPFDEAKFLVRFKRMRSVQRDGFGIEWIIEEAGTPVGAIACHHTDWKLSKTEIGYMAFPPSRGKGVIPKILHHLTELLISEYGFERIEIRTDVANLSSQRAAEKAGFTLEGKLRSNYRNQGKLTDDAIFSLIPGDLTR